MTEMDIKQLMEDYLKGSTSQKEAFLIGFRLAVGYFRPEIAKIPAHELRTYLQAHELYQQFKSKDSKEAEEAED